MTEKIVTIYTDGACSGNPGVGGWGAILMYNEVSKEISGGEENTTNNIMELRAVIEALKMLKIRCKVNIYTDSIYVKNGITDWINNWKQNGWKNSKRQIISNKDLWQELDNLTNKHEIEWFWIKGHNNNKFNDIADKLARNEIIKIKKTIGGQRRNRTDVYGFAGRCITTLLSCHRAATPKKRRTGRDRKRMEREKSLELSTSTLARLRSTN